MLGRLGHVQDSTAVRLGLDELGTGCTAPGSWAMSRIQRQFLPDLVELRTAYGEAVGPHAGFSSGFG